MVEQLAFNQWVDSSILSGFTRNALKANQVESIGLKHRRAWSVTTSRHKTATTSCPNSLGSGLQNRLCECDSHRCLNYASIE